MCNDLCPIGVVEREPPRDPPRDAPLLDYLECGRECVVALTDAAAATSPASSDPSIMIRSRAITTAYDFP
jgi:hypothetical protein